MDYTLNYLIDIGHMIGTFLKDFSAFLLMPIYDLPRPLIGGNTWNAFLLIVRALDPSDNVSVFVLFITVGISTFITVSIVKWVLDTIS